MNNTELKQFVQKWMDGHEEDTFIKNVHGNYMYSNGAISLNIKSYFVSLLEDYQELLNNTLQHPTITDEEIDQMSIDRYGNETYLFAQQREGFITGAKAVLSMMPQSEHEIQRLCNAVLNMSSDFYENSQGGYESSCVFCDAEELKRGRGNRWVSMKDLKHDQNCPYLIAKSLLPHPPKNKI